jgi:hypothetical protein
MDPSDEHPDDSPPGEDDTPTAVADDGMAPLINNTGEDASGPDADAPTG